MEISKHNKLANILLLNTYCMLYTVAIQSVIWTLEMFYMVYDYCTVFMDHKSRKLAINTNQPLPEQNATDIYLFCLVSVMQWLQKANNIS